MPSKTWDRPRLMTLFSYAPPPQKKETCYDEIGLCALEPKTPFLGPIIKTFWEGCYDRLERKNISTSIS
jgi:hypothetical protein